MREQGGVRHHRLAYFISGLVAAATVLAFQGTSRTEGHSTLDQTICGADNFLAVCGDPATGFKTLKFGPGEQYLLRTDLGPAAQDGRARRRVSLAYFGQITDWQLADEESPARAEPFDGEPFGRFSTSGFRPQEAMVIHEVETTVRHMNEFLTSPVPQGDGTRARMDNAVMTGDLADSMQRNETEWVRTLLEGGRLDPNSGTLELEGTVCEGLSPDRLDDPRNYTGVQDYDDYLLDNPLFYDPDEPRGVYEQRGFPTYPGLLDRAQVPFNAEGLHAPTYVAFGNHDALWQGTVSAQPVIVVPPGRGNLPFDRVAVNCLKQVDPTQDQESAQDFLSVEQLQRMQETDPEKVIQVPPDQNRQFVDKHQFKDIFRVGAQEDDHGFRFIDAEETNASNDQASYYSFSPRPGIRYIVLDTVSESGQIVGPAFPSPPDVPVTSGAEGNIDHPQWLWLQEELAEAEQENELTILFGHHNVKTLANALPDEIAPCTPPAELGLEQIQDEHGHDVGNPSCDRDPRLSTPIHSGQELVDLLHQHPNVIAFVAGHTHENEINPFPEGNGGGFWQITSPAIADWPPQHRVIEIMDNQDETLSIFATVLDHGGPLKAPNTGTDASKFNVNALSSIGRVLDYNDPQVGPQAARIGTQADRNVELLIDDPRD